MQTTKVVGIVGGMGPAAGVAFTRMFIDECEVLIRRLGFEVRDQNFPEHWLAQIPVPDRSEALDQWTDARKAPLTSMMNGIAKLASLGAGHIALACNTAHAWHGELQESFPELEILNIATEVSETLIDHGITRTVLLATRGTNQIGMYQSALASAGIECLSPSVEENELLMTGIYEGVKRGQLSAARDCFESVASAVCKRHNASSLLMGCTEIPLALLRVPDFPELRLIDAGCCLAKALAMRAYDVQRH